MSEVTINLGYFPVSSIHPNNWDELNREVEHDENGEDLNGDPFLDGDEIVVGYKRIDIILEYPLTNMAIFVVESETGFTRRMLSELGAKFYHQVYEEEDESTKIQPDRLAPNMLNRNFTDGKWGIWGHDIDDLILHTAYIKDMGTHAEVRYGVDS